jgi:hypothetical protein
MILILTDDDEPNTDLLIEYFIFKNISLEQINQNLPSLRFSKS